MNITKILQDIDRDETAYTDGWWETASGAIFGREKLIEAQGYECGLLQRITELEAQLEAFKTERTDLISHMLVQALKMLELEAQLAAVQKDAAWQPIETAPKDGTVILLGYTPHPRMEGSRRVYEGRWHDAPHIWASVNGFITHADATHWMPLPKPPIAGEQA